MLKFIYIQLCPQIKMEGQNKSMEGIRVAIRMRPLNEREMKERQEKIFRCQNEYNAVSQVKDDQPIEGQTNYFDKVFDEKSINKDVYGYLGKEIVNGVVSGINGTIFACKCSFSPLFFEYSYCRTYLGYRRSDQLRQDSHHVRWRR